FDEILVGGPCPDVGDKNFPDSAVTAAHGVPARVPIVEITHNEDHFGVRRPDGETHTMNAIYLGEMGAHLVVGFRIRALAVEVDIEIAHQGRKTIGIFHFGGMSAVISYAETVIAGFRA